MTIRAARTIALALLAALAVPAAASAATKATLRQDMRKLWEDHTTWTRLFIVSALADLPDKDATTQRLLQNQVDLGNAVKPFSGAEAGDKLSALLKDHILIAADIVTAAKTGDTPKLESSKTRWVATAELMARLQKDWTADVAAYEKIHLQALHMADMLSDGIAKQFPDKVK